MICVTENAAWISTHCQLEPSKVETLLGTDRKARRAASGTKCEQEIQMQVHRQDIQNETNILSLSTKNQATLNQKTNCKAHGSTSRGSTS